MKLAFIIIGDQDEKKVTETLIANSFNVTKLSSTGSFLKKGNCTLMSGFEDTNIELLFYLLKQICSPRKTAMDIQYIPHFMQAGPEAFIEVNEGGAVVFMLDLEQIIKL